MSEAIRASVAMAVYNGEKYIRQQIDSILDCMSPEDELVISYDRSTDSTRQIIDGYAAADSRVRVIDNDNPGVQNNFNNAVLACRGEYIFLADQDDVWLPGKIDHVVEVFRSTGADVVIHDGYITDENLNVQPGSFFQNGSTCNGPIRNIIRCHFWGCCMAFRASLRRIVCPFPNTHAIGHDLWIGVLAGFYGKIVRTDECLMKHRLHSSNVTTRHSRSLTVIVDHRIALIRELIKRARFLHRQKGNHQ